MTAIDAILRREGWPRYTGRAEDRGGPTKGGITLRTLSDWRGRPCTAADVKALTEEEARAIYTARYLAPFAGIEDAKLRNLAVDTGVLHGVSRAARWLQEAVGGLAVDGAIGPKTLAAVNAVDPGSLFRRLLARRYRGFADFCQHNPSQLANLEGWVNRANEFLMEA